MEPSGSPIYRALLEAGYTLHSCLSNVVCVMGLKGGGRCGRVAYPVDWPMRVVPIKPGSMGAALRAAGVPRDPSTLEALGAGSVESSWVLLDEGGGPPGILMRYIRVLAGELRPAILFAVRLYTTEPSWTVRAVEELRAPLVDPLGLAPQGPPVFSSPEDACRASLAS